MTSEREVARKKRLSPVRFPVKEWLLDEHIICLNWAEKGALLRVLLFLWTSTDEAIWADESKIAALCESGRCGDWDSVRGAIMDLLAPHPTLPGFLTFGPKLEAFRRG